VVHSDNWEMPPLMCHVFHSSSLCHSYIRTVTERTATDILWAVKCWMITLRHNKPTIAHKHFIAPHITTKLCPAVLHTHLLPGKSVASTAASQHQVKIHQFSPLLPYRTVDAQHLNYHYTDGLWKTYCWFFGYKLLNGNEIFDLFSLNFSVCFFPFTSQVLQ
jgi:hypothetical protein